MLLEESLVTGRIRSKIRALQGMRSRMISSDVEMGFTEESPEVGSYLETNSPRGLANMATMAQPRWQVTWFRQSCNFLMKKRINRRIGKLLLILFVLILLCWILNTAFVNYVSPENYNLQNGDNRTKQSQEKTSMWETMLNFFFPTTCTQKENQKVKACDKGGDLEASVCLEGNCCYSPGTSNFTCFAPFKDVTTQKLRLFGFGVISMIVGGCLPMYCLVVCRNSRRASALRTAVNKLLKGLKKQRKRQKTDTEMLGMAMESEEELDERKEEETRALLSE